ncbi:MAG: outer membrane beta-barrel protein [Bacteroidetes bacterium]|nr:outer membrane beta-barrel protein [Bacteroidota bacterium]
MKKLSAVILALLLTGSMLSAQSKIGVGINAAYLSPTGDFGDLYKSGFGGLASLTFDATENLQLSATVGYAQFSFNNDKFNQMLNDFLGGGSNANVSVDSKLTLIPIMAGGKYFFTTSNFKPYAAVDLGAHIMSVDGAKVNFGGQSYDATVKESKAAFAWGLGVGFYYAVAPKINLDVNAKINGDSFEMGTNFSSSSGTTTSSQSSKSTATYFSVAAGLQFAL